ncbi:MAG: dephospho-CoA kinase [Ignavibacteriaceae bacterium]|nr:dephospho-CoA kinase [Ignavibacteriaceae bacterium]
MKIAITGGIGSGKSVVSKIIESAGFKVFYADLIAKELLANDDEVKSHIIKLFGQQAYISGQLNKKFITDSIFDDKDFLNKLNNIIHPRVLEKSEELMLFEEKRSKWVFYEAALIFEAKRETTFDLVLLVTANLEIRIKRIQERDGKKRKDIIKIINSQIPEDLKIILAHYVIYNNSGLEELNGEVKQFLTWLKNR